MSALRETALAKEGGYRYYYMGSSSKKHSVDKTQTAKLRRLLYPFLRQDALQGHV